jgi:hypothetical protein
MDPDLISIIRAEILPEIDIHHSAVSERDVAAGGTVAAFRTTR